MNNSIASEGDAGCALPDASVEGIPCPDLPPGIMLTRHRITLGFPRGLALSAFSGFVLHGALGAALHDVSPAAYAALYGDEDIVRPWLITGFARELAVGAARATLELRLFNDAVHLLPELIGALMLAGCAGLGAQRAPFDVVAVETLRPGEPPRRLDLASSALPPALPLAAWCPANAVVKPIRVCFATPTALKQRNALVRTAPAFGLIIVRTLARLSLLAKTRPLDASQKHALLTAAQQVGTLQSNVHWHEEQRYSGRQKRTMPFGGIVGETLFSAEAAPFAAWLDAASLLGIGGKTTFGFGQLTWRHDD